jgi:hypothetical protein
VEWSSAVSYRSGEWWRRPSKMAQYFSAHQNNNTNALLPYNPYISTMEKAEHCESKAEYLQAVRFQQGVQGDRVRRDQGRAGK